MALDTTHERLATEIDRLHPYLGGLLLKGGDLALRLHADVVTLEHVLGAAMEDEDCAAFHVVEHAFADPETVAFELLALSPGMMVVGSDAALAFSQRALDALRGARDEAAGAGASEVGAALIVRHATRVLPGDARDALASAGFHDPELVPTEAEAGGSISTDGSLFRHFSDDAKRALSLANRAAASEGEPSIGPGRLVLALLKTDAAVADASGLTAVGAAAALRGRTVDTTPPTPRTLAPDGALVHALGTLPDGGDSLDLLRVCHGDGPADPVEHRELRELLGRHKVTASLLERARGAFRDPEA